MNIQGARVIYGRRIGCGGRLSVVWSLEEVAAAVLGKRLLESRLAHLLVWAEGRGGLELAAGLGAQHLVEELLARLVELSVPKLI